MDLQYKKGILVVSFGTSHKDTMDKTIGAIEEHIQKQYPEVLVYRAFTSEMILEKLKKTENLHFYNVREALSAMVADGVTMVAVQPTHMINGIENDKMLRVVKEFKGQFGHMYVGTPLLTSVADYKEALRAVMESVTLKEDQMLVLMGHGTDHYANASYPALEYTARAMGYANVLVGTVEGFPELQHVLCGLENQKNKRVKLLPFMVVAGEHAKNDMAGKEDSWRSILEEAGYEVETAIQGLGELQGIRELFAKHLREALEQ